MPHHLVPASSRRARALFEFDRPRTTIEWKQLRGTFLTANAHIGEHSEEILRRLLQPQLLRRQYAA